MCACTHAYIRTHVYISLSTLVLTVIVGIDKEIYGFLKNASRKQCYNNIFLQNTAIKSIGTMLLAP